ncbi:DUF2865 domain-containing protein [Chelatococcus daeguensis]|uniref:DUF2865 domain-containing protein n=1 Tax=Chelatococcus daeguensis TaxID=444444 RepID=UPI0007AC24DE|nr:DUF2865 domain-containing protein [Chelatococcus daeguensis]KZE35643.1 hypothetical protein AVW15_11820 [Chelatococcus daeguensis]MBM3084922.1 DUF2865 domain-containing protein [Chelatococcus daeguensis]
MVARSLKFAVATVVFVVAATSAVAQSPVCDRYRAELASLQAGPDPRARQYETAARRQRQELDRTRAYFDQLGCSRGRFLFFGDAPPPECNGLAGRIRQMENNLEQLLATADRLGGGPGVEQRRRHLQGMIARECQPGGRPRGFFESLFGGGLPPDEPVPEMTEVPLDEAQRFGGSRAVCVRTCDGYFFPLGASPGGREGGRSMCQALCPGAATDLYFMPQGGAIEQAASWSGQPYTAMPNAGRYKKTFDPACSCKSQNETWAEVLQRAEQMIEGRKGDIIVTAEKAEELSRPKQEAPQRSRTQEAKKPADAEEEAGESASALPTGSSESSGIDAGAIEDTGPTVDQHEGPTQDVTRPDGVRTRVRIVAPNVVAVPKVEGPVPNR